MRIPLAFLLAAGLALTLIGARIPEAFVLSLIGMLMVAGAASLAVAAHLGRSPRPFH